MFRVAALLWLVVGTAIAGVAMGAIVSVPEWSDQAVRLIPILCGAGFVLAMPIAYLIARQIAAPAHA